jgi:hypothetical protein
MRFCNAHCTTMSLLKARWFVRSSIVGYAVGISCGGAIAAGALLLSIVLLDLSGHLPPPAIANNVCLDEKLRFLRERSLPNPTLLVLGSSVAWRNFDGTPVFDGSDGRTVPLNLGFCGSQMNQIEFAAHYFLDRHRSTSNIALVVGLQDMEDCNRPAPFDAPHADQYLYGGLTKYFFYFKHFDLMNLARNAPTIAARRLDPATAEAMVIDRFGDGPSLMKRDLFYDGHITVDDACLSALRRLASDVPQQIQKFIVVVSPIHPDWVAKYDSTGERIDRFVARLQSAIAGTRATLWNAHAELRLGAADFGDAVHLRSPSARRFSRQLADRMGKGFGQF